MGLKPDLLLYVGNLPLLEAVKKSPTTNRCHPISSPDLPHLNAPPPSSPKRSNLCTAMHATEHFVPLPTRNVKQIRSADLFISPLGTDLSSGFLIVSIYPVKEPTQSTHFHDDVGSPCRNCSYSSFNVSHC